MRMSSVGPDRKTKLVHKDQKWSEERKETERKTMLGVVSSITCKLCSLSTNSEEHRDTNKTLS